MQATGRSYRSTGSDDRATETVVPHWQTTAWQLQPYHGEPSHHQHHHSTSIGAVLLAWMWMWCNVCSSNRPNRRGVGDHLDSLHNDLQGPFRPTALSVNNCNCLTSSLLLWRGSVNRWLHVRRRRKGELSVPATVKMLLGLARWTALQTTHRV